MASGEGKPLLNPVLLLRRSARPEGVTGGGKRMEHIRDAGHFDDQRERLAQSAEAVFQRRDQGAEFAGKMHLVASMFDDSLAPSWAPTALFREAAGCRLVSPARRGYLVEARADHLAALPGVIRQAGSTAARVDVSRVANLMPFGEKHVLRRRTPDGLWDAAPDTEGGRLFLIWLVPFRDTQAREALMRRIEALAAEGVLLPTSPRVQLPAPGGADEDGGRALTVRAADQTSLLLAMRQYRNTGHAFASVMLRRKADLIRLVASGVVVRVDPVRRFAVRSSGQGREPPPLSPAVISGQPIVAVVDGGLTAGSYKLAEAWRVPAFLPDGVADHVHGNRVSSLVVQAHAWNGNLALPPLYCRIGTVQAVPKNNVNHEINPEKFINYFRAVVSSKRDTKVWNLSFNEHDPVDPEVVSFLAHGIARVAREYAILPVISVGNRSGEGVELMCPPGDCEAALVVGGRLHDEGGKPAGTRCPTCTVGPGPDGMQKPNLSWFSRMRMLGGGEHAGSSYPTCLVSALAAHGFANLKEPTPDLVRALFLDAAELEGFNAGLGWGTPYWGHLPWLCRPGTVTLAWRSRLRPKLAYYWDGLPIPPRLVRDGKLYGKAKLTAILQPMTTAEGADNYFVTRVQTSLQYQKRGRWEPLLGSMKEDTEQESSARSELSKWQPERCHRRDFTKKQGLSFSGDHMRVFARVFARDLYQFDNPAEVNDVEHEVAFVLSFSDESESSAIYDETRAQLGAFVESGVLEQDVTVEL